MIYHDFYSRTVFFICSQINRQNKSPNYFRVLHSHPHAGHPACVGTLIKPPCRLHVVHRPVGLTNNAWGEPMGCPSERKGEFPPSYPVKCVREEAQIDTLWQNKKYGLRDFFTMQGKWGDSGLTKILAVGTMFFVE